MKGLIAAVLALILGLSPALAADFYAGKTVTMSTYTAPGDSCGLLRRAFDETMRDHDFLSDARKQRLEIDPLTGAQVQDVVRNVLGTPKPVINQIQAVLGLPPS